MGSTLIQSRPLHFIVFNVQAVIRFKNSPDNDRLEKVCAYFKSTGKKVPEEYLGKTFPISQALRHPFILFSSLSFNLLFFSIPPSILLYFYLLFSSPSFPQLGLFGLRYFSTTTQCTTHYQRLWRISCLTLKVHCTKEKEKSVIAEDQRICHIYIGTLSLCQKLLHLKMAYLSISI